MPMFPITFRTYPVGSPHSRKEGKQVAYAQGATLQEAEDLASTWLGDLSDAARVYTPADKPARVLGPVERNPYPVAPIETRKITAKHFVIFAEPR